MPAPAYPAPTKDLIEWRSQLYYRPRRITNHVWVGSQATAADPAFIKKNNIKLVVNCSKDIPKFSDVPMLRIPVNDSPTDAEKLGKYLPLAATAIRDVTRYNGNVLIHCHAGMNRSATTCAGYLMTIKGMTAKEAMEAIRKKKPETFRPMNFKSSLTNYEKQLRANGIIKDKKKKTNKNTSNTNTKNKK
ncbi:dual specificity protein phosphatase 16 / mitogen-activated protein kinase phosphatase 7 [Paramecium bursaria Chlorella virus OR0704.2.2]|nr:dual specificity protein phosphatase 16 / mitogen-activated protein kinase phosphatase 7 [Paramecium bursaria Chlorella virus OR0704.2.2]